MTTQTQFQTLLKETLEATRSFRTIIEQETAALKQARFTEVADLSDKKKQALQRYQDAVTHLSPFQDKMKTVSQNIKDMFKKEKNSFDTAVEENKQTLERAGYTTRRLSERVISIAKDVLQEKSLSYTQNGLMQKQATNRPVYMSVNETL